MNQLVLTLGIGVAFLVLHELGHALAAKLVGANILSWGFNRRGPHVHVRVYPPCRWKASICLLSGPLVHLLFVLFAGGNIQMVNICMLLTNMVLPHSDGWKTIGILRS